MKTCSKIRKTISNHIRKAIKRNGGKKSNSILNYLPYTINELLIHLESKFESWMSWDNWGVYNSNSWDDNDPSTWTWQIDHIIPHSKFCYSSMNSVEFTKCWALSNLRPLSAKQNIMDGDRK